MPEPELVVVLGWAGPVSTGEHPPALLRVYPLGQGVFVGGFGLGLGLCVGGGVGPLGTGGIPGRFMMYVILVIRLAACRLGAGEADDVADGA
jgi:hypothetical protein